MNQTSADGRTSSRRVIAMGESAEPGGPHGLVTPDFGCVSQLMARWWHAYDEGDFDSMRSMLTADVSVEVQTDSGTTAFEEFIRADAAGIDEVMAWFTRHRLDSPYPLRHHSSNLYLSSVDGAEARFSGYIFVTNVVGAMASNLASGVVTGTVRALEPGQSTAADGAAARLAALTIRLDMTDSVNLGERES